MKTFDGTNERITMKLLISGLTKLIFGIVLIGLMLFLPAQTFNYFGAWLFMGVLMIPVMIMGAVLFIKAPDLLEKKAESKRKRDGTKGCYCAFGLDVYRRVCSFSPRFSL